MSFKIQQLMITDESREKCVKPPESAVKKVFLNPFNIQLIEPKDHFFDSEDRAERKHAKRKNATITKFGARLEIPFFTVDSGGFTHCSRDSSYIAPVHCGEN
jgi:hypothetical protein